MEKGVKAPCEEQRSASQCDREQSRVNKKKGRITIRSFLLI